MASLGQHLRELRTRRNMSLEDIARTTRVASRYLAALESDELAGLPAPAFTRGFIRAYCQVLGEPPDAALALYDAPDGTPPAATPSRAASALSASSTSEPETARSRSAVLVSFVLLVVLGIALFAVTLMIHPPRDAADRRTADTSADTPPPVRPVPPGPPPTAPALATQPPATQPPTAQRPPPPSPATPGVAPTAPPSVGVKPPGAGQGATSPAGATAAGPPAAGEAAAAPPTGGAGALKSLPDIVRFVTSPYRLVARMSEPTWVRVRMAEGRVIEETVPAGQVREWVSNEPFVLTIGNAGGVTLELNGRQLPSLGASGAVIARLVLPPGR